MKSFYVNETYPKSKCAEKATPRRNYSLLVSSAIGPDLVVAYDDPPAVADAMTRIGQSDYAQMASRFENYGECLATPSAACTVGEECSRDKVVAQCIGNPATQPWSPNWCLLSSGAVLQDEDCIRLATAIAHAAEGFDSMRRSMSGGAAGNGGDALAQETSKGLENGLIASWTLAAALNARGPRNRAHFPALALSGGSANGAFTAGYAYALLEARELAVKLGGKRAADIRHDDRLGAVASTSVGSLVAIPIDLYFTEPFDDTPDRTPTAAEQKALAQCLAPEGGTIPKERPFQTCALSLLSHVFLSPEWDLLCNESGTILSLAPPLLGGCKEPLPNVLQFLPLQTDILTPLLTGFHDRLLRNDLVRTAMAVDYDQHVLGALDERACLLGPNEVDCIESAIMASVVLPVFTHWIDHVYTGISGSAADHGVWFDGGMRSETPAFRANAMTDGRVLSINTGRAESVPSADPSQGALDVVMRTMSEFVSQIQATELAMASLRRDSDSRDRQTVEHWFRQTHHASAGGTGPILAVALAQAPEIPLTDTRSVFVPDYIRPNVLYADGYAFDPWVTRGLFVWGEHMFLTHAEDIYRWLRWTQMAKLVHAPQSEPAFKADYDAFLQSATQEWQGYVDADKDSRKFLECYRRHRAHRRDKLNGCLRNCGEYGPDYRGEPNSCDAGGSSSTTGRPLDILCSD